MNVRAWLRKQPQPHSVKCDDRVLAVPDGTRKWAELEATVLAVGGRKLEAIGKTGETLRVCELDDEETGEVVDSLTSAAAASAKEQELVTLARILADTADRAAQRHAQAYELSFTHLVQLVQILAARLGGLETSWQQAMVAAAEARAEAVQAQGGEEQAAFGLLASMMPGAKPAAAAKPTNGKAAE